MPESKERKLLRNRPTLGVLAGWQFYHTATSLSYLEPIFSGVIQAAQDLDCNMMLGCGMGATGSMNDPLRPAWPSDSLDTNYVPIGPWNTDALIITNPLLSDERSQYIQQLIHSGFPVIFVGAGEIGDAIVADNESGIVQAMNHLVEHGHKSIAFIAGSFEDMKGDTGVRLNAYQNALKTHDLTVNAELIVFGRHVFDGGYEAMNEIIASGHSFSAVMASNDESAMGAIQALKDAGFKVPEDVAVIGFDDRPEGVVETPSLTSIHVSLFDIGYRAVERMVAQLNGHTFPDAITSVPTHLVIRESCGCDPWQENSKIPAVQNKEELIEVIGATIFNMVQNLTESTCMSISEKVVSSFVTALKSNNREVLLRTLDDVLRITAGQESTTQIWFSVVSILEEYYVSGNLEDGLSGAVVKSLIENVRNYINKQLTKLYSQAVFDDRSTSSRLGLLTAEMLSALNEDQVFGALKEHLPAMDINIAIIATTTESDMEDVESYLLQNVLAPMSAGLHVDARDFPPKEVYGGEQAFILTLIPMMDRGNQIGFVVFDSERLKLYGSIVRQLVGALTTVELYRQAMEDRRLAEEANSMKGRFLSTISHELRTPLNLIVGLSGLLIRDMDENLAMLPEQAQRDIEKINAYSQHLGALIGDVLDLATSDAGRLKLNFEALNLGMAMGMVETSGRQLAIDKNLTWKAKLPDSGPWVRGDRTRLRQIALNLINNAIKFTESGSVSFWSEESDGKVTVFVQDTGMGVPVEERTDIFDEFYRTEKSVTQGISGLGLGLAISRRLLKMHGGTIGMLPSEKDQEGSTFYFTLPVIEEPSEKQVELSGTSTERPLLLLLTNNSDVGQRFRHQMGNQNTNVKVSMLDDEAIWRELNKDDLPDGIVVDIGVSPDMGWQLFNSFKNNPLTKSLPVMFYTSADGSNALLNFDYLTKPIDQQELTRAVDQHLMVREDDEAERRSILLVDDDLSTRELHARIVQSHSESHHVFMAKNGREALDIMTKQPIHLVLLDLQMPEVDGFEVLEAMNSNASLRSIPVIVVTGQSLSQDEMSRLNQGVSVVLRKGLFKIEETIAHISETLDRKKKIGRDAQRLVRKAMVYMQDHYTEPISRSDIAQQVGITDDYMTYCFRQELGTTPIQYLRRLRVNRARTLLINTNKSITEIAVELGFKDSNYFSRVFRRETGLSPESFRTS